MEVQPSEKFEQWCVVEIFGHQTFAGYVTERTIGGAALIQVDVPQVDEAHPAFTKLFGAAAIYAITPTTEEHARQAAAQIRVRPLTLYILPEPTRRLEVRRQMGDEDVEGYRLADARIEDGPDEDDDLDDDDEEDDDSDDSPF